MPLPCCRTRAVSRCLPTVGGDPWRCGAPVVLVADRLLLLDFLYLFPVYSPVYLPPSEAALAPDGTVVYGSVSSHCLPLARLLPYIETVSSSRSNDSSSAVFLVSAFLHCFYFLAS